MLSQAKLREIAENKIFRLQGDKFQDFIDTICLKLHPGDYQPVRAGGRRGDMKNDGYCPQARIFYAAFGTRGSTIAHIKQKIQDDLDGCLKHHSNVVNFGLWTTPKDREISQSEKSQ